MDIPTAMLFVLRWRSADASARDVGIGLASAYFTRRGTTGPET
jgi:hypothetical protein